MKQKLLIFLSICYLSITQLFCQNLQLIGDSILPNDPEEWVLYNSISLKTNYGSSVIVKSMFEIIDIEGNICFQTDSFLVSDTISANDTLDMAYLFRYATLSDSFAYYFHKMAYFKSGYYQLKLKFYDSTYNNLIDSCLKNIQIVDDIYPALIFPYDLIQVQDSQLNTTNFKWTKAKKMGISQFYYKFRIFEINDSSDLSILDYGFENNTIVYESNIINDTSKIVPNLFNILDTNKLYGWSICTYTDSTFLTKIVANKGITPPYILKPSQTKRALFCTNPEFDGFESNSFNGWLFGIGLRNYFQEPGKTKMSFSTNPTAGRHSIESSYDDPRQMETVPQNGGFFAMKLGREIVPDAAEVQSASRTFFVTASNCFIPIRYASVLNFGTNHPIDNMSGQPYLQIAVISAGRRKGGGVKLDFPYLNSMWAGRNDNLTMVNGGLSSRSWDCDYIDLTKYIGRNVTLQILNSSCVNTGHWAYSYIDFCGTIDPTVNISSSSNFCVGSDVTFNGSSSTDYTSWYYSIQACNSAQTTFFGSPKSSQIFVNSLIPTSTNVNALIASTGYPCGYYKLTLFAKNKCSGWIQNSILLQIVCPALGKAGIDKCCPSGVCNIQIGTSNVAGNTYQWAPTNCLSNSTISNPFFNTSICTGSITFPLTYSLTVTDAYSCIHQDEVVIYNTAPTLTAILQSGSGCERFLSFVGSNYANITWSWTDPNTWEIITEKNAVLQVPNYGSDVTFYLALSNPCGTVNSSVTITGTQNLKSLKTLKIGGTEAVVSRVPIFGIQDMDLPFGAPNAYAEATDIILEIWDSYGGIWIVYEHHGSTVTNGSIQWNCKLTTPWNSTPTYIPNGEYTWRLSLKNCTNNRPGDSYEIEHRIWYSCTEWKGKLTIFPWPPRRACSEGGEYIKETVGQFVVAR